MCGSAAEGQRNVSWDGFCSRLGHQSSVSLPEHPDISAPPRWANRGGPGAASGGALGAANRGKANRKVCVFLAPVLSRSPSHPDGISVSGKGSGGPKIRVFRQSCGGRKRWRNEGLQRVGSEGWVSLQRD